MTRVRARKVWTGEHEAGLRIPGVRIEVSEATP